MAKCVPFAFIDRSIIWKSFAVSERIEEEAGKKIVKRIPRKKV